MTDPREAISRLTRWKAEGLFGDGTPYQDARLDKSQFYADVVALLSLVEKQQEALTAFTQARVSVDGGPANAWGLGRLHEAWVKACACLPASLSSPTGGDRG